MIKRGRKIDRINLCKQYSLPTVEAREFFYNQKKDALKFARQLSKKFGSFNLRTDSPPNKEIEEGHHYPFFKGINIQFLSKFMQEKKDSLSYIVHENVNDDLLLFNARVYVDQMKTLRGEINRVDKTSNRVAMKDFPQNLEQISVGFDEYYQKNRKVNDALFTILFHMIDRKLWPYILTEVTTHHKNSEIRYIYWEIIKREKKNFLI